MAHVGRGKVSDNCFLINVQPPLPPPHPIQHLSPVPSLVSFKGCTTQPLYSGVYFVSHKLNISLFLFLFLSHEQKPRQITNECGRIVCPRIYSGYLREFCTMFDNLSKRRNSLSGNFCFVFQLP